MEEAKISMDSAMKRRKKKEAPMKSMLRRREMSEKDEEEKEYVDPRREAEKRRLEELGNFFVFPCFRHLDSSFCAKNASGLSTHR